MPSPSIPEALSADYEALKLRVQELEREMGHLLQAFHVRHPMIGPTVGRISDCHNTICATARRALLGTND